MVPDDTTVLLNGQPLELVEEREHGTVIFGDGESRVIFLGHSGSCLVEEGDMVTKLSEDRVEKDRRVFTGFGRHTVEVVWEIASSESTGGDTSK